jgi:hypothetical protein
MRRADPMRIPIFGRQFAGKSTVALTVGRILADIRKGPLVGFATMPTSTAAALALSRFGILGEIDQRTGRSLRSIRTAVASAAGGVFVLDDRSAVYERALETWRDASEEARERADLPRGVRMSPESWSVLNREMRDAIDEAAVLHRVDLVEVYRQGEVYSNDLDFGRIATDGVDGKGENESGRGGELVLQVLGGLRSSRPGRSLRVLSDTSGTLNGAPDLPLTLLSGKKDAVALRTLLRSKLDRALRSVIAISDEARETWISLLAEEIPDEWDMARDIAERSKAEGLAERIKGLMTINGMMGQDAQSKQKRAVALMELFSVGHVDELRKLSPGQLEAGMERLGEVAHA